MEYQIKPKNKFTLGLKELWEFRELLYFFTWRDVKVKYKQTVFGVLWAILQPLVMMVVFTTLLGKSISKSTDLPVPYSIFALSGLLVWGIFSNGVANSANSMVNNANIIKKIYFPRLIIPISAIMGACFDFVMALIIFFIFVIAFQVDLNIMAMLYIPFALIFAALASTSVGLTLAALNVKYRDIRYVIPFLIQALLFLTPVFYPISITSNYWMQLLLKLNPIAGAIEIFRGSFSNYPVDWNTVGLSGISCIVFLILGVYIFRKTEAYFADLA